MGVQLARRTVKNFLQVAAAADVLPLLLEIHRQPELWDKNPCRLSTRAPHHETQDIILRYKDETPNIASGDWSKFSDEHLPEWYASIDRLPAARRLVADLMARVGGEMLGAVFIYKLKPGAKIHSHIDTGWHAEFYDKYNVCLQSNASAAFVYEDESMVQKAGDVHLFRNDIVHSVVNSGCDDHIILNVCIRQDRGHRVPWSPAGWSIDGPDGYAKGSN